MRLCIFAHFNARGTVDPWIIYHLSALRPHVARLVFVSNSPLDDQSAGRVRQHCDELVTRPNKGFDFAAWKLGLANEKLSDFDEVLLTNSSIVGPLFSLESVFSTMAGRPCDFWGLTAHEEMAPHVQSYFLCFRQTVLASPAWKSFWSGVVDIPTKGEVIRDYEVGLTTHLTAHGLKGDTLIHRFPFPEESRYVWKRRATWLPRWKRIDRNEADLTIFAAPELVSQGMPYIKASLIWGHRGRSRPKDVQRVRQALNVHYDWTLLGID
ncbi:MAG: hypothetical protein OEY97_02840 [Nitrospirota bacterium]|nr:hypothetical protein [Nitrospirota bacterium]